VGGAWSTNRTLLYIKNAPSDVADELAIYSCGACVCALIASDDDTACRFRSVAAAARWTVVD